MQDGDQESGGWMDGAQLRCVRERGIESLIDAEYLSGRGHHQGDIHVPALTAHAHRPISYISTIRVLISIAVSAP